MTKTNWIFILGNVTAYSVVGIIESLQLGQAYDLDMPWWFFAITGLLAIILASYLGSKIND